MTSENVSEAQSVEIPELQPSKAVDDQLVDQLVVHRLCRRRFRRFDGLGLGHVVAGRRRIFHDRESHRTFYSPYLRRAKYMEGSDFDGPIRQEQRKFQGITSTRMRASTANRCAKTMIPPS
ncbi:hypothetical protein JL475_32465 [Streptomyces sp. M2CJ-2]|uniref:hypothetical protein n=1 Tax=Streptomyces sp. M2CJ-2 TaxID=2803948 RepID=UPI001925497B|nr:hypothetical protein [Streptomyces sp. M2CJ-2]MBL3670602.1 hypothetical protein [Streptomyces sp. M2CJ-2]